MEIYFVNAPKSSMLLWNPYFRVMFVEPKITKTGKYPPCVMLTIGRRIKDAEEIDEKAIKSLPKKVQDEILKKYSNETLRKAPLTLKDKIQNAILDSVSKINSTILKTAGISVAKSEGKFEIYEYIKIRSIEDMLPVIYGCFMGLGVLCYLEKMEPDKILGLRKELELRLGKFLMLGYDKARQIDG